MEQTRTKPSNVTELRDQLLEAFASVRDDPRRANQVKEMTNAAGKVLTSVALELEYEVIRLSYASRGATPKFIPFLGSRPTLEIVKGVKKLEAATA